MQFENFLKFIHKEGVIFVFLSLIISVFLSLLSGTLGMIGILITLFVIAFFRNPERVTPVNDFYIISPADGRIINIAHSIPPQELNVGETEMVKISIYLSIFDVHVNRVPASGKVMALHYHPGKFFNASLDKASVHNERQSILLETNNGHKIIFVQIAGLVARRIVCELEEGDQVKSGQRFGIIRFGSRLDVYLPADTKLLVAEGQTVVAGETILADLGENKEERFFEVR